MPEPISIFEAELAIRQRQLTPPELLEQCLDQIDRHDDQLRAWVVVDASGARQAAQKAANELAEGLDRGPLHGVPVGIKDIIDVRGFPTRAGSPLRGDRAAEFDAPVVAALRRAGAVILGKTVTVEFACFDPSPSRNPWDPALGHSPGGSSSGSAVAVAAGMCPGALGTQTGGSLVRPAAYCGIATCKPTFGCISIDGIVPVSHHLDHPGPMARCVRDLEILLHYLPRPNYFGPPATRLVRSPIPDASAGLPQPPRLGLVERFFMEKADPIVQRATEAAIDTLRQAGASVEPVPLDENLNEVLDMHSTIMAAEAAAYHRDSFATHRAAYGPMIRSLLDAGLKIAAVDYAAALAHQRAFRRRVVDWFTGYDALIMPATDTTAPPTLDTTGPKTFQSPWSYAGVPVVSIPSGRASNQMPAAVQLVKPHHQELELLAVAKWCEKALDFQVRPPMAWR